MIKLEKLQKGNKRYYQYAYMLAGMIIMHSNSLFAFIYGSRDVETVYSTKKIVQDVKRWET